MFEDFIFEILSGKSELNFEEAVETLEEYYSNKLKKKVVLVNIDIYKTYQKNGIGTFILPCVVNAKYYKEFKDWKIYIDREQDDNENYIIGLLPSFATAISPKDIIEVFSKNGFDEININFAGRHVLAKRKCVEGHCKVLK